MQQKVRYALHSDPLKRLWFSARSVAITPVADFKANHRPLNVECCKMGYSLSKDINSKTDGVEKGCVHIFRRYLARISSVLCVLISVLFTLLLNKRTIILANP